MIFPTGYLSASSDAIGDHEVYIGTVVLNMEIPPAHNESVLFYYGNTREIGSSPVCLLRRTLPRIRSTLSSLSPSATRRKLFLARALASERETAPLFAKALLSTAFVSELFLFFTMFCCRECRYAFSDISHRKQSGSAEKRTKQRR